MPPKTETERIEDELDQLGALVDRLNDRPLQLHEIERYERTLSRGHAANLLRIDRILREARERNDGRR